MSGKVLNIEVGDRLIKVCFSVKKGKVYQIKNSFMFQTPQDAVSDGNINSPELLGKLLAEKLAENGLGNIKEAVFPLVSAKVAIREVTLPPIKENRIQAVVQTNAAEYFPVDISKYHITYNKVKSAPARDKKQSDKAEQSDAEQGIQVSVLAAPVSMLEGYFKLCTAAGLELQAIDYCGNSQYQALKTIDNSKVTMYVNVECSSAVVSFMSGDNMLLQRSFYFGGDEMITSYMSAADMREDKYIDALRECSVPLPDLLKNGIMSEERVEDALSRLVSSIARTVDFFNSANWKCPVERVVLLGACSRIAGLCESINVGPDIRPMFVDELENTGAFANSAENASTYISCIGSSIAPLNFMPEKLKVKKKQVKVKSANQIRDGVIVCSVCVIAALVLSLTAIISYLGVRSDKKALEAEIAMLKPVEDTYNAYVSYTKSEGEFRKLKELGEDENSQLVLFFEELENKMPSKILVMSAACSKVGVSMNITVPTLEDSSVVLVELRDFESIYSVETSSVTREEDEAGFVYYSFAVACMYEPEPEQVPVEQVPVEQVPVVEPEVEVAQ